MPTHERPRLNPTRRGLAGMLAAAVALPATMAASTTVEASDPDAVLIALADELDSLDARSRALCAAHPRADYGDISDTQDIEARRWDVLDAIATTPAATMKGFAAKARVLRTNGLRGDLENHEAIADSLAADLLAATA